MKDKNNELKYELPESFIDSIIECCVELESSRSKLNADALKRHYHLARDLAQMSPDEDLIRQLEDTTGVDLVGWLLDLPTLLPAAGMTSEALQHQRFWAGIVERANLLGDRVQILGKAGMRDEAYEQIAELDREFPNDVWVHIKIGDALYDLHQLDEAEKRWRKALTMSDDEYDNEGALERLIPLLEELGRVKDAKELERTIRKRHKKEAPGSRSKPKDGAGTTQIKSE